MPAYDKIEIWHAKLYYELNNKFVGRWHKVKEVKYNILYTLIRAFAPSGRSEYLILIFNGWKISKNNFLLIAIQNLSMHTGINNNRIKFAWMPILNTDFYRVLNNTLAACFNLDYNKINQGVFYYILLYNNSWCIRHRI